ncbi:hypothetical protein I862_01585 [endosymbiont of Acanthamoeba sp. UWC8]|uniref:DUF2336 domain-containing protein n=1 Tax=endosymbiont of Acanthamoeba sp. UWC8 TaxID=86106 RepID=UPI0004D165D2|nr:DUF2336 domain-containing protein [endosymbiont of Acanthamoeba sp. UWC8]AIF80880.1 hypothetical protein I862_01585 [endosymbiont of Acanthamoeba sp. UWC8]
MKQDFSVRYSAPSFCNNPESINSLNAEQKYSFALQVCYFIENGYLYEEEDQLKDYLKQLTIHPDLELRVLIANRLKNSKHLPHEIALKLALDINKVAAPIIADSPQLNDYDLITLLNTSKETSKLIALTKRNNLSEEVCFKVVSLKNLALIISIIQNPGSQISFELYRNLLNTYYDDQSFLSALLMRKNLDNRLLQKLVIELKPEAKNIITKHFNLYINNITKIFCPTDINSFEDKPTHNEENELRRRIDQLYSQNSLNNAIIIHYLCKGDLYSFLYSIAKLSDIPFSQIRFIAINRLTTKEFENLYYSSGLPVNFMEAIQTILTAITSASKEGVRVTKSDFPLLISKYLKENKAKYKVEGIGYLLKLIFLK